MAEQPPESGDTVLSAPSPWPSRPEWATALDAAYQMALEYLATLPQSTVSHHASPEEMAPRFDAPLPERGCAPEEAVREWFNRAEPGIVRTPGPRYYGFVTGGATPASLAGDWLASAIDQNPATWLLSPAASQTELTAIRWLLELFGLPDDWSGVMTSGATMSNLCGLAAARHWVSGKLGFDATRDGLGGRPVIPVLGSDQTHQSALKALGTLGLGRDAMQVIPSLGGVIDLEAFGEALSRVDGPAIVIANAGEVNTGAFDDIRAMAARCAEHEAGAWLHVDGAFGLYAALAPGHAHLLDGVDLADSVATDAHKWLNVPYDCGVVFVRDRAALQGAFAGSAAYLTANRDDQPWNAFEHIPEFSRRFRALAVWCALRAAGRDGYREIVEQCIANAGDFADWIAGQPGLELLAPAHLNIVCFRAIAPAGRKTDHDTLTSTLTEAIQRGGQAYVTATTWDGQTGIRAAFDNWATGAEDVLALKDAVLLARQEVLAAAEDTRG